VKRDNPTKRDIKDLQKLVDEITKQVEVHSRKFEDADRRIKDIWNVIDSINQNNPKPRKTQLKLVKDD
jgi:uncharacterized protein YukE